MKTIKNYKKYKKTSKNKYTKKYKKIKGGNVDELLANAMKYEKIITPLLKHVKEGKRVTLEGLAYNIKSRDSLERKVSSKIPRDVLRYTFVIQDDFTSTVDALNTLLRNNGITLTKSKNYFCTSNIYKGLNRTYMFDGYEFEIQFHSPQSFEIKMEKIHSDYEKFRTSKDDSEKCNLSKKMSYVNNVIHTTYNSETCVPMKFC
jgi:hypothetical protein